MAAVLDLQKLETERHRFDSDSTLSVLLCDSAGSMLLCE